MFLGGIPEAAASASMLTKAGYRPRGDLRSVVDGAACRGSRGSSRQGIHRQQRRPYRVLRRHRRRARIGRTRHDSGRARRRRFTRGAPDCRRLSVRALSGVGRILRLNSWDPVTTIHSGENEDKAPCRSRKFLQRRNSSRMPILAPACSRSSSHKSPRQLWERRVLRPKLPGVA
jgi:hypothetical protein